MKKIKKSRCGFTLVELLAVMAVIGILIALVLGISGYASFKADEAKAKADIEHIKQLLQQYRADSGVQPKNYNWEDEIEKLDKTFYIETDELKDPWGNKYQYERESKYVAYVWSMGPDGQHSKTGGEENKDNIGEYPPN